MRNLVVLSELRRLPASVFQKKRSRTYQKTSPFLFLDKYGKQRSTPAKLNGDQKWVYVLHFPDGAYVGITKDVLIRLLQHKYKMDNRAVTKRLQSNKLKKVVVFGPMDLQSAVMKERKEIQFMRCFGQNVFNKTSGPSPYGIVVHKTPRDHFRCSICKNVKHKDKFARDRTRWNGRDSRCTRCKRRINAIYFHAKKKGITWRQIRSEFDRDQELNQHNFPYEKFAE